MAKDVDKEDFDRVGALVRRHMPALDGVRGVAILLVLVHNLRVETEWHAPSSAVKLYGAITEAGWVGVQLFFVLSGFLITGLLLDSKNRPSYFRTFYVRRVLRIFPLYYAALTAYVVLAPIVSSAPAIREELQRCQVWYWTYLSNWSDPGGHALLGLTHFWSLAVEEQFYLAWPFVVLAVSRRALATVCVVAIAASLGLRCVMVMRGVPPLWIYEITPSRVDALAMGALAAVAAREPAWLRAVLPRLRVVVTVALIAIAAVVAKAHSLFREDGAVETAGYTALAISFAVVVLVAAISGGEAGTRSTFSWPPLRQLGKYSYGVYVLHVPIKLGVLSVLGEGLMTGSEARRVLTSIAFFVGVSALSIVAAMVSWHVLEKRFLALKDAIAPARTPNQ